MLVMVPFPCLGAVPSLSLLCPPQFVLSSAVAAFALVGNCCGARGARVGIWRGLRYALGWSQHQSELQTTPDLLPCDHQSWVPLLYSDAVPDSSRLRPSQLCVLLSCGSLCPSVELCCGLRGAGGGAWCGLGHALVGHSFSLLPLPYFGSKQACVHSSRVETRFLTATLSVPLDFKPAKRTHPPCVGPQIWGAHVVIQTAHYPGRISKPVLT